MFVRGPRSCLFLPPEGPEGPVRLVPIHIDICVQAGWRHWQLPALRFLRVGPRWFSMDSMLVAYLRVVAVSCSRVASCWPANVAQCHQYGLARAVSELGLAADRVTGDE